MTNQITLTAYEAQQALDLISEYLFQGGTGFDADALEKVAEALSQCSQINIPANNEAAND